MMDFFDCVGIILKLEGGAKITNDPSDPGGLTKYGISKRAYPALDIANLSEQEAIDIYGRDYWKPAHCNELSAPLNLYVFDTAVNMGTGTAMRLLQEVAGVPQDGLWGPRTHTAVVGQDQDELAALYLARRALAYSGMRNFDRYGKGWLKRLFIIARAGR